MVHKQKRRANSIKPNQEDANYRNSKIKIMYSNVDGLLSKLMELKDIIKDKEPQVICLTETKLNTNILDDTLNLENYNVWRKDRKIKQGGGVMILTSKELQVKQIHANSLEMVELIAVEIKTKEGDIIIATVYMPPQTRTWEKEMYTEMMENTTKSIRTLLQNTEDKAKRIILNGDFNCNVNWESMETKGAENHWDNKLVELTQDFLLYQHVTSSTRKRGLDEPSLLDLVFTRQKEDIESIIYHPPLGKSDHVLLEYSFIVAYDVINENEDYKNHLNYRKGDYIKLKDHFKGINWEQELTETDVDTQYLKFCDIYKAGVLKHIPYQREKVKKVNEWFNHDCVKAREKRDLLWNRYRRHNSEKAYERYKHARNEYTAVRKEAQIAFEKDIIDKSKDQPKLFYSYIKSKSKVKDKIQSVMDKGQNFVKEEEICEILNNSFQSVFTKERPFEDDGTTQATPHKLGNIILSRREIKEELKNLDARKANGPDEISNWVLKECAEELSKGLQIIFQNSLDQGKLPEIWKKANIVPLYKKGNRQCPLNYRPVSLTSVVCKLLEKLVRKRWVDHLEKHEMLSESQYGFRKGKSCVTNLLSYYDRVAETMQERDGWVDSIYLDFKKAFDRVPHERLIWKLEYIGGIQGCLLKWMQDFLNERKMRTILRGKYSSWREVTSGVPQGSVLAPIMFLVYINDINENIGTESYLNMFADDAKIQRTIKNEDSCKELQKDLTKLYDWSHKWQMEFNAEKCHVMKFGKSAMRPDWDYQLGSNNLMESHKEKDLGVVINNKLSPEDHINDKIRSTYNLLANMRVAFAYIDEEMVKKIITSFIRPTLEYAAVVWSPHLKKHIKKIEKVQRAATRWVPSLRDLSYEERLAKLQLPTLEERRKRGDMIMLYKCVEGKEKIDRNEYIIPTQLPSRGHSKKLFKKRLKKDVRKYSFPHRAIDQWNALPEEVVCANNIHKFKEKYDNTVVKDGTLRA